MFRQRPERKVQRIAAEPDETKLQALIRLEVACELALEALPELPSETEQALREPIERLCRVTRTELERIQPGLKSDPRVEG